MGIPTASKAILIPHFDSTRSSRGRSTLIARKESKPVIAAFRFSIKKATILCPNWRLALRKSNAASSRTANTSTCPGSWVAEWHFSEAENSASGPGSEFAKKHFGEAAMAYRRVRLDNVDEKYREVSLYKTGWAQIESVNRRDGILSLTKFLKEHPESSLASSALAKRAVSYQADEDHDYALADFQELAEKHPEAPEVEFSLQQVALIFAHQKKTSEMINAYNELLKRFPNTNGAGEAHYWIGVGYFDLEQHQQAVPELEKARDMDAEYGDKATLRLVICHYQLENIDALATEAKRYIESAPPENANAKKKRASIPPPVIEYLGKRLAANGDHERAEYFLSLISTPDDPSKTTKAIWGQLAKSRKILKKHVLSITAWDNFLLATERPSERANAYLQRGISQLCMQDYEAARNSAQESLRSQKEGPHQCRSSNPAR